jgi:hypothetical protein
VELKRRGGEGLMGFGFGLGWFVKEDNQSSEVEGEGGGEGVLRESKY